MIIPLGRITVRVRGMFRSKHWEFESRGEKDHCLNKRSRYKKRRCHETKHVKSYARSAISEEQSRTEGSDLRSHPSRRGGLRGEGNVL